MVDVPWVSETLQAFGRGIGVTSFDVNDNGVACLQIGDSGDLYIEPAEDDVLVYVSRDFRHLSLSELERALSVAHPAAHMPMDIRVGLKGDAELVAAVRLTAQGFTLAVLEESMSALLEYLGRVSGT